MAKASGSSCGSGEDQAERNRRIGPLWTPSSPGMPSHHRAGADSFCAFVCALGIVVLAVRHHGLDPAIGALVPEHADLLGLLWVAGLAALLANLVNNIPATLVLVPAVAHSPGLILAVLIGVNVGPNLTYVGSLATLLWRQILHAHDARPVLADFLRLGIMTVPACLVAGVTALWAALKISGVS